MTNLTYSQRQRLQKAIDEKHAKLRRNETAVEYSADDVVRLEQAALEAGVASENSSCLHALLGAFALCAAIAAAVMQ